MSVEKRKVLVIGSGGREHALARRLAAGPDATSLFVLPGNGGTEGGARNVPISVNETAKIVDFAASEGIDLAVIGPEAPLVAGLSDALRQRGVPVFGPSAAAARIEGSKAFMKRFCARHQIPTSPFEVFERDPDGAARYIRGRGRPVVVKADGLCAGKGVVVASDPDEAERAARAMLSGSAFGDAGRTIVVEDRIDGPEASVHAICDGERFFVLPAIQDHKRIGEGDLGPNTGGMGAYGPAPLVTAEVEKRIVETILAPSLAGFAEEGIPFIGALFAGIIFTPAGDPILLEYNVRFGDPETEVLMDLVDGDLFAALAAAAQGALDPAMLTRSERHAMAVVLAAEGYPAEVTTGDRIEGLEQAALVEGARVLHAGTRRHADGSIVTSGGRVLVVTASGVTLRAARDRAYEAASRISFRGMQLRRDIGHRALRPS
jgi:phosphoribosylamine--glycine ligase